MILSIFSIRRVKNKEEILSAVKTFQKYRRFLNKEYIRQASEYSDCKTTSDNYKLYKLLHNPPDMEKYITIAEVDVALKSLQRNKDFLAANLPLVEMLTKIFCVNKDLLNKSVNEILENPKNLDPLQIHVLAKNLGCKNKDFGKEAKKIDNNSFEVVNDNIELLQLDKEFEKSSNNLILAICDGKVPTKSSPSSVHSSLKEGKDETKKNKGTSETKKKDETKTIHPFGSKESLKEFDDRLTKYLEVYTNTIIHYKDYLNASDREFFQKATKCKKIPQSKTPKKFTLTDQGYDDMRNYYYAFDQLFKEFDSFKYLPEGTVKALKFGLNCSE